MIGHLYTLLFVGGEAPAVQPPAVSGGWTWNPPEAPRRRTEEPAAEVVEPPKPAAKVERLALPTGQISPAVSAYLDALQSQIAQASRQQEIARRALEAARADAELQAARDELAAAIELERIARQQVRNIDIAFVVAVLIES
jgi:hypothetical protein